MFLFAASCGGEAQLDCYVNRPGQSSRFTLKILVLLRIEAELVSVSKVEKRSTIPAEYNKCPW